MTGGTVVAVAGRQPRAAGTASRMTPRNYLLFLCDDLVLDRIVREGAVAWFTPDHFPSKNGRRHV